MRQHAVPVHSLQLLLVQKVHLLSLLAEEQPVIARLPRSLTLLKKRPERSNSRPWPNHDDWSGLILRQPEARIRVQEDRHRRPHTRAVAQMAARQTLSFAPMRLIPDHPHRRLHIVLVHRLARRDRVHPRRQPLQHMKQLLWIGNDTRKICRQVHKLPSPAILFRPSLVIRPNHHLQPRNVRSQLCILPHGSSSQFANPQPRPQRLFQADLDLIVVQNAFIALITKSLQHTRHRLRPVLRNDPDSIPGGVRHTLIQRQLDVTCLFLRALSRQQVILPDVGYIWIVTRVLLGVTRRSLNFLLHYFTHLYMVKRLSTNCTLQRVTDLSSIANLHIFLNGPPSMSCPDRKPSS